MFDSRIDTYKHIQVVQKLLGKMIADLQRRQQDHDQSKLSSPEVEYFDKYTPKLSASTYGSDEYKQFLSEMKPALDHHYAKNSHHPEFYPEGVRGMNLLDLVEMICDWRAATMRHHDGNVYRSVEVNQKRFGYSDELKQIFLNTLPLIEEGDKGSLDSYNNIEVVEVKNFGSTVLEWKEVLFEKIYNFASSLAVKKSVRPLVYFSPFFIDLFCLKNQTVPGKHYAGVWVNTWEVWLDTSLSDGHVVVETKDGKSLFGMRNVGELKELYNG